MFHRKAFTLVELLVVIAILALLLAILLPVLSKARESANRLACSSNLRQLGMALRTYAHDNRDWFPTPSYWYHRCPQDWINWDGDITQSRIYPYIAKDLKVLRCPSDTQEHPYGYPFSYSVNYAVTGYGHVSPSGKMIWGHLGKRLTQIRHPERMILALEEVAETVNDGCYQPERTERVDWPTKPYPSGFLSIRHDQKNERAFESGLERFRGRGNVVFVDGHCAFFERWKAQKMFYTFPDYTESDDRPLSIGG